VELLNCDSKGVYPMRDPVSVGQMREVRTGNPR
jgi:hypothetical protein